MSKKKRIFHTGDKVRVTKILDEEKAKHLGKFIGEKGMIINWISFKGFRYKVRFNELEHHYFFEDEIELVSVDK